jgi:hypothetical protein
MAKVRRAEEWRASREVTRAWADRVRRAFGSPARTKPRNADEARVLREAGTPERLIGPSDDAAHNG